MIKTSFKQKRNPKATWVAVIPAIYVVHVAHVARVIVVTTVVHVVVVVIAGVVVITNSSNTNAPVILITTMTFAMSMTHVVHAAHIVPMSDIAVCPTVVGLLMDTIEDWKIEDRRSKINVSFPQ